MSLRHPQCDPERPFRRRAEAGRSRGASVTAGILLGAFLATGLVVAQAQGAPSALGPEGPPADRWWLLFWMGMAVYLVVLGVLLYGTFRQRGEQPADRHLLADSLRWPVIGGAVIPAVILIALYAFSLRSMGAAYGESDSPAVTVEVIGHQFWWEVRYPDENVVTANEIHIPAGRPVQLQLTSGDVLHSFWVPELSGKLDLIPGKTNTFTIEADDPDEYRGQCAEFCGVQHANMAFLVVAEEPETFEAWLAEQREPASDPPADSLLQRGQQVFLSSACLDCHTVRGTDASGQVGPDLTHLASRRILAAGMLENNRGNLAGWIVDPQHIKPGNKMPAVNLTSEELQALLAYLMSLE